MGNNISYISAEEAVSRFRAESSEAFRQELERMKTAREMSAVLESNLTQRLSEIAERDFYTDALSRGGWKGRVIGDSYSSNAISNSIQFATRIICGSDELKFKGTLLVIPAQSAVYWRGAMIDRDGKMVRSPYLGAHWYSEGNSGDRGFHLVCLGTVRERFVQALERGRLVRAFSLAVSVMNTAPDGNTANNGNPYFYSPHFLSAVRCLQCQIAYASNASQHCPACGADGRIGVLSSAFDREGNQSRAESPRRSSPANTETPTPVDRITPVATIARALATQGQTLVFSDLPCMFCNSVEPNNRHINRHGQIVCSPCYNDRRMFFCVVDRCYRYESRSDPMMERLYATFGYKCAYHVSFARCNQCRVYGRYTICLNIATAPGIPSAPILLFCNHRCMETYMSARRDLQLEGFLSNIAATYNTSTEAPVFHGIDWPARRAEMGLPRETLFRLPQRLP